MEPWTRLRLVAGPAGRIHRGSRGAALVLFSLGLLLLPSDLAAQLSFGDFTYTTDGSTAMITGYTGNGGTVTIPGVINGAPVTAIGYNAFGSEMSLTNVTIPDSVTNIGPWAFSACYNLTNIALPANLLTIGDLAFEACWALPQVALPGGVTSLGQGAFLMCNGLTQIHLPASVASLSSRALGNCALLSAISVDPLNPNFVSVNGVLFDHSQSTLIQYPAGKTGNYTVPYGTTSINTLAFEGCRTLTNLIIPNSVTNLADQALGNNDSLGSVTLPNTLTSLGMREFFTCQNLSGITIPDSVTDIGDMAFDYCTSLTNLVLPANLASVGFVAFEYCTSLTNVVLPASLSYMDEGVFEGCTDLPAITVVAANPYFRSVGGVLFNHSLKELIQYPAGGAVSFVVPPGITTIAPRAFDGCSALNSLFLPETVTSLGDHAFYGCASLTNLILPPGLTQVGDACFGECPDLQSVYFTGLPPTCGSAVFIDDNNPTVYYLSGTAGWGTNFGGVSTATWAGMPPSIKLGPQSQMVGLGDAVSLAVSATGTSLHYAWLLNGSPIAGATTYAYTILDAQPTNAGDYSVVISNNLGSVTSAPAQLMVEVAHIASGTAIVMNGFVVQITLDDGGWGYTNPPSVSVVGGGGSGAQAVAILSNGRVVEVEVLDAGYGYTNTPQIVISPPYIPPATIRLTPFAVLTFTNLSPGQSYQLQSYHQGTWVNCGGPFAATNSLYTQVVSGPCSPGNWRMAVCPVPVTAAATPQVFNGFLIGATVTDGGWGYTTNPAVTIVSNGAGNNAVATATVSGGAVAAINILRAGSGYTVAPSIVIAPPPIAALWPLVTPMIQLNLGGLSPSLTYQPQFAPALNGPWSNAVPAFNTSDINAALSLPANGNAGFFRLVPSR